MVNVGGVKKRKKLQNYGLTKCCPLVSNNK